MKNKDRKFKVGDIVSLKGERELFKIVDWFYECSYNIIDGWYERSNFTIQGQKSGKYIDCINEEDRDLKLEKKSEHSMLPLSEGTYLVEENDEDEEILEDIFLLPTYDKPLTKEEIDFLLDKYNDYMNVHLLVKHLGINENEYEDLAKQIMEYLLK